MSNVNKTRNTNQGNHFKKTTHIVNVSEHKVLRLFSILPLIITLCLLPGMDSQMPTHYDSTGAVDTLSSKYTFLILPIIILVIGLIAEGIIIYLRIQERGELQSKQALQYETYAIYINMAASVIVVTLCFMHCYMMYMSHMESRLL